MPAYHACTAFDVMHRLNIHLQFFGAGTADPNLEAFNKSACGAAEQVWRRSKSLLWGGEAGTANPNLESFKKLRAGPHSKSGGVQKSPLGGKVLAQPIQIWRRSPKIACGATTNAKTFKNNPLGERGRHSKSKSGDIQKVIERMRGDFSLAQTMI